MPTDISEKQAGSKALFATCFMLISDFYLFPKD
jgi:hypothetical protein